MIPARDAWGPWANDITDAERTARCRCLRAVVTLTAGPRGETLTEHLRLAERDPAHLPLALAALNRLAGLDLRHTVASYGAINRPRT